MSINFPCGSHPVRNAKTNSSPYPSPSCRLSYKSDAPTANPQVYRCKTSGRMLSATEARPTWTSCLVGCEKDERMGGNYRQLSLFMASRRKPFFFARLRAVKFNWKGVGQGWAKVCVTLSASHKTRSKALWVSHYQRFRNRLDKFQLSTPPTTTATAVAVLLYCELITFNSTRWDGGTRRDFTFCSTDLRLTSPLWKKLASALWCQSEDFLRHLRSFLRLPTILLFPPSLQGESMRRVKRFWTRYVGVMGGK